MKRQGTGKNTEATAEQACKAFSACANYPSDIEGRKLLAETLESVCKSQGLDPYDVVRRCTEASSWCPTPFDIRKIASQMSDAKRRAPAGCEVCDGTGWVHSVRRVETPAGEYDADYSELCRCALGQFIAQGERSMREARAARGGS